ncbi:MAG: hypothetical protein J0L94_15225 [Rhodothermia bacterium]|nr:hypothetical protein [Rhodothermia bacterium]
MDVSFIKRSALTKMWSFEKTHRPPLEQAKTKSDQRLCQSVIQLFEQDLAFLNICGLHFYLRAGILSVQGTLKDAETKKTILALIANIDGIHELVDMIDLAS